MPGTQRGYQGECIEKGNRNVTGKAPETRPKSAPESQGKILRSDGSGNAGECGGKCENPTQSPAMANEKGPFGGWIRQEDCARQYNLVQVRSGRGPAGSSASHRRRKSRRDSVASKNETEPPFRGSSREVPQGAPRKFAGSSAKVLRPRCGSDKPAEEL